MNTVKTRALKPIAMLPIMALSLLPLTAKAQNAEKTFAQKDTASTVIVDNSSLQQDVFEKSSSDTTTLKLSDVAITTEPETEDNTKTSKESTVEKVKQAAKGIITDPETKVSLGMRAGVGTNVPGAGIGAKASFYNNNVLINIDGMVAKNDEKKVLGYGADAAYYFDLNKGWFAYPRLGFTCAKIGVNDAEKTASNIVAPRIAAGFKYMKGVGDVVLSGGLEGGGALVLEKAQGTSEYENSYNCQKVDLEFLARISAQYKNIRFLIEGGKDVNKGYNVAAGVDFTF